MEVVMEDLNQNEVMNTEEIKPPKPDKRRTYFFKTGPQKNRRISYAALGAGVASLLIIFLAAFYAITAPITRVPMFAMIVGEDEIEELEDLVDEVLDEIDDAIENDDDDAIERLEDELGVSVKKFQRVFKTLSLYSIATASEVMGDDEASSAAFLLIAIICVYAVLVAIFAAFAVGFMKKGLMIAAYVISILYYILFSGVVYLILATVACIVYFVLLTIANQNYKRYKRELEMSIQ